MKNTWKKILALSLAVLMVLGTLIACGKTEDERDPEQPPVEEAKESPEEAKVLKILTLGHSLAVDSGHLLNLICATEGVGDYEEVVIGTLYSSGRPIKDHVAHTQNPSQEYYLYVSSSKTPNEPPKEMRHIDMIMALEYDYWDVVVMQDGVFEIARSSCYTSGDRKTLQEYVSKNKLNTNVRFAWHMTWVPPTDSELRATFPRETNSYDVNYQAFNNDRTTMYNNVIKCVTDHIVTDETIEFIIPSATAFENALSSYLEEKDIHRDYVHATDLGRVIASYTWYCKLLGIDKLEEIKLSAIPKAFLNSTTGVEELVLTDTEKAVILEAVNNALANPMQMTQSQYTQAPAQ